MPRPSIQPEERLRAVELLLLWEGRVSRARLLELFAVHETMASRDIAAFRSAFPAACVPAPANKAYIRTAKLRPTLSEGNFGEYEHLVGAGGGERSVLVGIPNAVVRADVTPITYPDHSALHQAIRSGDAVSMTYRSMNNPMPHRRVIRPHALIKAGTRWHVRAWCTTALAFRDFNLGRITQVEIMDSSGMPAGDEDAQWWTKVTMRLVPHPLLSPAQRQMVRDEYMQGTTALVFEVEMPLVHYVIQAYRAGLDPNHHQPPEYILMVEQPASLPAGSIWGRGAEIGLAGQ